jgi:endonuclease YncB( thermonuclease family)
MLAPLLAALVALGVPPPGPSPTHVGTVVRVVDGDTVHVRVPPGPGQRHPRKFTVRLYGVDSPEPDQPFGAASARALERFALGKEVEVFRVTRDGFGRVVAFLRVEGADVSSAMVRGGHAWAFRRYLGRFQGDEAYCVLEYQARAERSGLWGLERRKRTAPWVHRRDGSGGRRIDAERSARDCIAAFEGR